MKGEILPARSPYTRPTCVTTTASGPQPIKRHFVKRVQQNILRGVQAQSYVIASCHCAKLFQLVLCLLKPIVELRHIGVGQIRGDIRRHSVPMDVCFVKIAEYLAEVGNTLPHMRAALPPPCIIRGHPRLRLDRAKLPPWPITFTGYSKRMLTNYLWFAITPSVRFSYACLDKIRANE